jgi:single-stranded DNA-binding protein
MDRSNLITLYGNVGGNPETRTLPAKTVTKSVYDAILDDMVEKEFRTEEREVRTFSIAVSQRDKDGTEVTRWIRCDDWKGLSRLVAKGDRVKVTGRFRQETYQKEGETKTVRKLILESLEVERRKIRREAA